MRSAVIVSLLGFGWVVSNGCMAATSEKTTEIKTGQFRGRAYEPSAAASHSVGIVLIGGSEGQLLLADAVAPQLAAMGYRVLGVNYHGGWADRSRPLSNVPLEQFSSAVDWMQMQPKVQRLVVIGESRGSEAALLTAVRSPRVSGVIGMVPSIYVWSAVGSAELDGPSGWSEGGKPLTYVRPIKETQPNTGTYTRAIAAMQASSALRELEQATIPIERIRAPILLIGGGDDAVWPSGDFVRAAQDRIKRLNPAIKLDARSYPDAGHRLFGLGSSSPTESYEWSGGVFVSRYGGTEAGNARARASAWKAIAAFLERVERGK
jgi:uncharacterized protein